MARRVHDHQERAPARRVRDAGEHADGYFFPGEVARLLELDGVDYHQLRRIFRLVREQAGLKDAAGRQWSRFSFRDLARTEAVLRVCGGREALGPDRKTNLTGIKQACAALRGQGFTDPLLQVPLVRQGRRILALVDGAILDPVTGQLLLQAVSVRTELFLAERAISDPSLREALANVIQHPPSVPQLTVSKVPLPLVSEHCR